MQKGILLVESAPISAERDGVPDQRYHDRTLGEMRSLHDIRAGVGTIRQVAR